MSHRRLLGLVRAALWDMKPDIELFTDGTTDWDEIGRQAMDQAVGALALSSALSLPDSLQPPVGWKRKACAFLERNRRTHRLVDSCVSESSATLRKSGINAVLLKGQAYARAYPSPELRQCGDIDLYIGDADFRRSYDTAKEIGWTEVQKFHPYAKHCGFSLRGVRIELHRTAALLSPESVNRRFQGWSRRQLTSSTRCIEIGDRPVPVPGPLFDVVFVFLHLYHHFLHGGIGLRHVCDWTMLLHMHAHEIDDAELHKLLKGFRLLKGWKSFAPIAVDHLGLPEAECPMYSIENRKVSERILSMILKEGNFGRASRNHAPRPEGYLAGKIHSLRHNSQRLLKRLPIDPHTIMRAYLGYIYKGLARVINDTIIGEK